MPAGTRAPASLKAQAVADAVRAEMRQQNISGRKLAQLIGKSEKYVRERVAGKAPLDLNDLELMANVLHLDAVVLLERADKFGDSSPMRHVISLTEKE